MVNKEWLRRPKAAGTGVCSTKSPIGCLSDIHPCPRPTLGTLRPISLLVIEQVISKEIIEQVISKEMIKSFMPASETYPQ